MAGLAVFDLDRTLTTRGGYMAFIFFVLRRHPIRWLAAPPILVAGLMLSLKIIHRDTIKQLIWRLILGGMTRTQVTTLATAFADHWIATALRPSARVVIAAHVAAGDHLMLATAAMDVVAEPFGKALGFQIIVATKAGWTESDKIAPVFDSLNCYGAEKLVRVQAALPSDTDHEWTTAYSDHVTDLPLLTWAATGVAVNPHPPLLDVARTHDLRVADWDIAPPASPV